MKIGKLENGEITINVYDLFQELDEEERKNLADIYSLHDEAYKALVRSIQTDYASDNMNPGLYKLRKAMIVANYEYPRQTVRSNVVECIRDTVHQIIRENVELKIELQRAEKARPLLYDYIKNRYGNDLAFDVNSRFIDLELRGIENKYAHNVAYEDPVRQEHDTELKELVNKWFEELYGRFTAIAQSEQKDG